MDNLAKRGIHITISCMLHGVNPKTVGDIFLHYTFTLKLLPPERDRLAFSSWTSSVASF